MGTIVVALGLSWKSAPEGLPRFPLGNLPGDIRIERGGFRFFMLRLLPRLLNRGG